MPDEEFTPEEQAALQEMQQDDAPVEQSTEEPKEGTRPDPVEEVEAAQADLEEKAPAQAAPAPIEPKKQAPPEGMVPHQAMHAERVKRQELERKIAELEARLPQPEAEKPPEFVDPLEDPDGFRRYDEYQRKQAKDKLDSLERQRAETYQRQQRVEEAARFEQEFAAKTPDYADAVKSLHTARVSQLQEAGFSQDEIRAQIHKDALNVFEAAKMADMNPAEMLYMRARQYGYQKAAPAAPDEGQRLQALASAQKNTQGIGNVGGSEQSGRLTASQLAEMSEAELAKVPAEDIERAMGG